MGLHSQQLKGILEGCLLYIISKETIYGYQIGLKLKEHGFGFVREGSIYPILLRLQKQNCIEGFIKPSPSGPDRKYYTLTHIGKEKLDSFIKEWTYIKNLVSDLLKS